MEVCDPEVPTPITTADPDARSAGDLTRALPAPSGSQPERASSPRAQRGTGASALRPGCAHPSNCRGAPCTAAGQRGGKNDREEGGAGGQGSTYSRPESASSSSLGREGTASRLRKRPRAAPPRTACRLYAAPGFSSLHPPPTRRPRMDSRHPPCGFPRDQTLSRLPAARATGGSLGVQRRRALGTRGWSGPETGAPRRTPSSLQL